MKNQTLRILAPVALALFLGAGLQAAGDPFLGTWKLNLAKSNAEAAATFKSATAKMEPLADGLKTTADIVSAQGVLIHTELAAKYDGMDYPVTGDPYSDTIAVKRIDANHADTIWKKGGRVVATGQMVVSPDGKTWTETIVTRDGQGKEVTIVAVYDKQIAASAAKAAPHK